VLRRKDVTGDWRKLHNEELRDMYSLCGRSNEGEWVGRASGTRGEKKNTHRT
jgi:hypothetical protein